MSVSKGLRGTLIGVGVSLAFLLVVYRLFAGSYNRMISLDEAVKSSWSQVEAVLQRRLDLIPNLVSTVKGYAEHESDTLKRVAEARSRAGGVMQVGESALSDPEKFARFQRVQAEIGGALGRLLLVSEQYPALRANGSFLALQSQLEGTENRISVERTRYNRAVQEYNAYIRSFPRSAVARWGNFSSRPYFTAHEGAVAAPRVRF